jgi:hypothetical protein
LADACSTERFGSARVSVLPVGKPKLEHADCKVDVQMNVTARDLAPHLLAGPICASTLVERLRWFFAWHTDGIDPVVIRMLDKWGRVAGLPYTGPELIS